ncbi:hypothetical protein YC2023_109072 [Brassica napus]
MKPEKGHDDTQCGASYPNTDATYIYVDMMEKFEELYMFSCGIFTKLSSVIRGDLVLTISRVSGEQLQLINATINGLVKWKSIVCSGNKTVIKIFIGNNTNIFLKICPIILDALIHGLGGLPSGPALKASKGSSSKIYCCGFLSDPEGIKGKFLPVHFCNSKSICIYVRYVLKYMSMINRKKP